MKHLFSHWVFWYVCGVAMVIIVLVTCLVPSEALPSVNLNDKLEHMTAYLGLAVWFGGLLPPRRYFGLLLCLLALGAGIEILQGMMNLGRNAEWKDFFADAAGALLGLLICLAGLRHWASWIELRVRNR